MTYTNDEINNTVETIIKKYYTYRAMAQLDKEDLKDLFAKGTASYDGMPHGTDVTDQTLNLVERRNEPTLNMKRARAIEIIYDSLKADLKEFCKLYFFEQNTMTEVKVYMHIEKDKFYGLKNAVVKKYRDLLPWRNFGEQKEDMQINNRQKTEVLPNKTA
ncbi:hypothetical protein Ga0466249_002282 [Sporomusaceae bacterium BoRhaA]|uniref:hypothetical protein n=1 Tax=Pelorhabdus rhamnosifermentans TaxID=2772457 RepID=UPI001C0635B4|nr:hypothetical protein [Pelorhabdus rhamnosifermentans]MBU2701168.1 hypothetical protein [Pelorhabdus rhamnosifermentans]